MSRGSVATVAATAAAILAGFAAGPARALSPGYGKGRSYCGWNGNAASRYRFDDVYACATTSSLGPTTFDSAGRHSFQCVELSARFLWAIYRIWAGPGTGVHDGADVVDVVHTRYPSIRRGFPAPGSVPVAGDIVSLGPGGAVDSSFGHTAVVISADQRHGRFRIMSQNLPVGYAGEQALKVDLRGRHNGRALLRGVWTTASWLELRHRRRPTRHRPPR